jgi:hypothetical protein
VKRFRVPALLMAAFALAAITAASALAAQSKAFTASYKGTVTEKVSGQTVNASAKGTGSSNLLGKGSVAGGVVANTGAASQSGCAPFNGPGKIMGTKGTLKVNVLPSSKGCAASQDEQDNISLSGNVQVKGGTGKFAHAKGNLHFSGHYDRGSGAFTVKLTGSLSY